MKVPRRCTECNAKLEYLSDIYLQDNYAIAEIEGNCPKCGAVLTSKLRVYQTEVQMFDKDGNSTGTKIIP